MKKFIQYLRKQTITKWTFLLLCTCCFIIARGELVAQAKERISFDEYGPAIIYTPVRSAEEVSAKDSSNQAYEMSICSCIQKEYQVKTAAASSGYGLAWGTISKVLPK